MFGSEPSQKKGSAIERMAGAKAVERGWPERRVVEVVSVGLWRWPCGCVGLL